VLEREQAAWIGIETSGSSLCISIFTAKDELFADIAMQVNEVSSRCCKQRLKEEITKRF
jgi:hypothetical protein